MIDLDSIPYVPARDQWPRGTTAPHIWIVLHSIESGEFERTAESCAAYFQDPRNADGSKRIASTQFVVDVDSTIRCADWNASVAGAVGANVDGWHIEQAGFAGQSEGEWNDTYSTRMVLGQTAPLVAALAVRDGIPLEFVDAAGLRQRRKGVTTHAECYKAFGGDVRTDPGRYYPMDRMLAAARRLVTNTEDDEMTTKQTEELLAAIKADNKLTRDFVEGQHQITRLWLKDRDEETDEITRKFLEGQHEITRTWLNDRFEEGLAELEADG